MLALEIAKARIQLMIDKGMDNAAGTLANGTPQSPRPDFAVVKLARSPMLRWALDRFQSIPFAAPSATVLPVKYAKV